MWFSKEEGLKLKEVQKYDEDKEITEYKDYKFNELTEEDMARPDLTGYNIINSAETQQ